MGNFTLIETVLVVISASLLTWISILTILFINLKRHYNRLAAISSKQNLQEILEEIFGEIKKQDYTLDTLKHQLKSLIAGSTYNLQYLGFLRFNPYGDTGGEQSFALALLDQHKSGLVISSLHNRENTRIYAKKVINGLCEEFPLSAEEKKAITIARALKA